MSVLKALPEVAPISLISRNRQSRYLQGIRDKFNRVRSQPGKLRNLFGKRRSRTAPDYPVSPRLLNRRRFLRTTAAAKLLNSFGGILPGYAQAGRKPELSGTDLNLTIATETLRIGGRRTKGITINGVMPGPLIRPREGDDVSIRGHNQLDKSTSIHWHGLILSVRMDSVPGVSYADIPAGETFI